LHPSPTTAASDEEDDRVDFFLFVHSSDTTSDPLEGRSARHGSDATGAAGAAAAAAASAASGAGAFSSKEDAWSAATPEKLRSVLTYVSVDFSAAFEGNSYHGAWPSVAYWWAAGPEMLGAAGYQRALYLDGDILALPPPLPQTPPTMASSSSSSSSGGFQCSLIESEVFSLLSLSDRSNGGSKRNRLAGMNSSSDRSTSSSDSTMTRTRMVAGAVESSLGVMVFALGGGDSLVAHEGAFGIGVEPLLHEHLTVSLASPNGWGRPR
jgi:hypothetical protein